MKIFKVLQVLVSRLPLSNIRLSQFYGIELDDFAHEVAILSLWLIDHQMNMAFKIAFGEVRPSLPLKQGGHIICGNATRVNWEMVCPIEDTFIIYIVGNLTYQGARKQSKEQKIDVSICLQKIEGRNNLDYVSCWILKAADYILKSSESGLCNNKFDYARNASLSSLALYNTDGAGNWLCLYII